MNWTTKLTATGLAGLLLVAATGCPPDDEVANQDPNDDEIPVEPAIASFDGQPDSVTSGQDVHDAQVGGEVALSWETEDAEAIELFANDDPVDLSDCEPAEEGDDGCVAGGSLDHQPSEDTTYRLEVVSDADAECIIEDGEVDNPDLCASETVDVDVYEPALMELDRDDDQFDRGEEFTVDYTVENAREFEIGIVEDGQIAESCEVDGDGPCVRDDADAGELTLSGIEESITLSGEATNGADDGLGDVEIGDVELSLHPLGAPVVEEFEADPTHIPFGGETTLMWETDDAVEVEIDSDFTGIIDTDLSEECTEVDEDGSGECDVQFSDEEFEDLDVLFTAVAHSEDGEESEEVEISVVVGQEPAIEEFDVVDEDDKTLPAEGGDIELTWDIAHNPTEIEITADDDTVLLAGEGTDEVGTDQCQSGEEGCNLDADVFEIHVDQPTEFTLTATSPIGSDDASVSINLEGAPEITELAVDGEDALDDPVVVEDDTAELSWTAEDTDDTELERADMPEDGCSDADWSDVGGFDGEASGEFDIEDIDQTEQCFRLTATEDQVGQSASATFEIARAPEVASFHADPETTAAGDDVTLLWEAPFASEVEVTSPDTGHIEEDDLEDCTEVDDNFTGTCEVQISPGTAASDVEFNIEATGYDDLTSGQEDVTVFIGHPPEIVDFCAQADTAGDCQSTTSATQDQEDIHLDWELEEDNATDLTIVDNFGVEVDGVSADETGSVTVHDVEETTTWTLEVENDFGSDSSDATAFFGPVIEQLDINGEDGLEDEVEVDTGDVTFDWETSDTDDVYLDDAEPQLDGDGYSCDAVDWEEVTSGAADDEHTVEITENTCYRLVAENPDQTSSVTVLVRDVPFVTGLETTPDEIDGADGGDVTVYIDVVGATAFNLEAVYYDEDEEELDDTHVCDQDDASGESLDGSVDEKTPHCDHSMSGEPGLVGSYDPPQNTEFIRYYVDVSDNDGESSSDDTGAYDEDVEVDW